MELSQARKREEIEADRLKIEKKLEEERKRKQK